MPTMPNAHPVRPVRGLRPALASAALCSAALLACMLPPGPAAARGAEQSPCGDPFRNHFGPFDYRKADKATRALVENVHFTPGIESMTRPGTTTLGTMASDVGYTLHVFPNHHRALITMMRLSERHKTETPPGARFTVNCYFDRAVRFQPDDTVARALYATYLGRIGQKDAALLQLRMATDHANESAISHFNIGLAYLELGAFQQALEQAHRARAMGLQRTELEDALRKAGYWRESAN